MAYNKAIFLICSLLVTEFIYAQDDLEKKVHETFLEAILNGQSQYIDSVTESNQSTAYDSSPKTPGAKGVKDSVERFKLSVSAGEFIRKCDRFESQNDKGVVNDYLVTFITDKGDVVFSVSESNEQRAIARASCDFARNDFVLLNTVTKRPTAKLDAID